MSRFKPHILISTLGLSALATPAIAGSERLIYDPDSPYFLSDIDQSQADPGQNVVLRGGIGCSGETRYESAIGGRGTRVTFEGNFELKPGALSGLAGALTTPLTPFVESIVTTLIPKNLRKVIEAAARTPQPSSTP